MAATIPAAAQTHRTTAAAIAGSGLSCCSSAATATMVADAAIAADAGPACLAATAPAVNGSSGFCCSPASVATAACSAMDAVADAATTTAAAAVAAIKH